MRLSLFTATRFSTIGIAAVFAAGAGLADAATITVGNMQASGPIAGAAGNDGSTMSFDNNGEFLAVVVTMSGDRHAVGIAGTPNPSVTYGGTALTQAIVDQDGIRGWSAIYYLSDPAASINDLSVQFGADVLGAATAGSWEIGAFSLSNVDTANPIAGSATWLGNNPPDDPDIIESSTPGAISAGDFLVLGQAVRSVIPSPRYETATDSQQVIFYNANPVAGSEDYQGQYALLLAGDISGANNDELALASTTGRPGAHTGVVFNAIPEPGSLALLGLGGLLMLGRGRTQRVTR